jgi:hypothetical protein
MKKEVRYYDVLLKAEFDILALDDTTEEDLMLKYKDDIHRAVYKALKFSMEHNVLDRVPCFLINDNVFDICIDEYKQHVDTCLKYFLSIEEYEKCAMLNKFHDAILKKTLDDNNLDGLN